jgi:N6-adenosine-specific RNA methylase IME4
LADPPWKYGKGFGYGAGEYYPLMELDDIKKLPIKELSDENAHLYLWCPNSLLPQALDVMKCWGFEFKTVITWVKHRSIFGYYFKGQSEQLLFGVRGKLPPQNRCQVTIINGKVTKHSKKPFEQYSLIEQVSPFPRLELFAREKAKGWDSWGNEIKSDIKLSKKNGCWLL